MINSSISSKLTFIIDYQPIAETLNIGVVGSCATLGCWQKPVAMQRVGIRRWRVDVDYGSLPDSFDFKFVVFDPSTSHINLWEDGDNRIFSKRSDEASGRYRAVFRGTLDWHGAGVAVPVFSLRRPNGWGVGEFTDLCLLADWCVATHQKIIQILPVNDTNISFDDTDSYPYRSVSIYALNPIYVNIDKIGEIKDTNLLREFEQERRRLDEQHQVQYSDVLRLKLSVLRQLYREQRADAALYDTLRRTLFCFEQKNSWLLPYAVFRCLADDFGTGNFYAWGDWASADATKIRRYATDNAEKVEFYYFVQYHLFKQFREAKSHLNAHSIYLKGDIPVGVGRLSVDVWQYPHLFNTDKQAGAPPDDFSDEGQNWGFPTYNWDNMSKDGYSWWRQRFSSMQTLFDAVRIDHILGFFRIWEIPLTVSSGLLGYFSPALPLSVEEIRQYKLPVDEKYILRYSDGKELIITDTDNVLFIEDPYKPAHYHPRIMARKTQAYKGLTSYEREVFYRLYNDYFYRRHNEFWRQSALNKLSVILDDIDMLVCGEDLGMVPASVPDVMRQLNILSLEVLRMPKEMGAEFVALDRVPYNSVVTTGTHDTSTLRMWWGEDRDRVRSLYGNVLRLAGEAPERCTSEIAKKILALLFETDAMWAIIPIQDYLAINDDTAAKDFMSERINYPDNPNHTWSYRLHLPLEEILRKNTFNITLGELIKNSGR